MSHSTCQLPDTRRDVRTGVVTVRIATVHPAIVRLVAVSTRLGRRSADALPDLELAASHRPRLGRLPG